MKTHNPMGGILYSNHTGWSDTVLESGGGNADTAAGRSPLPPRRAQSHSGLSGVDAVWILPRTKASLFLLKDSGPQSHWQVTEVLKTLLTLMIYWVLLAPGKPQMALIPSLPHPFVDLSDAP